MAASVIGVVPGGDTAGHIAMRNVCGTADHAPLEIVLKEIANDLNTVLPRSNKAKADMFTRVPFSHLPPAA